jgi:hypothetical protein
MMKSILYVVLALAVVALGILGFSKWHAGGATSKRLAECTIQGRLSGGSQ